MLGENQAIIRDETTNKVLPFLMSSMQVKQCSIGIAFTKPADPGAAPSNCSLQG
jgi:hypothetical protein